MSEILKQGGYPDIEIESDEKDIIQLWQRGKTEVDVILIERKNIPALIDVLKKHII